MFSQLRMPATLLFLSFCLTGCSEPGSTVGQAARTGKEDQAAKPQPIKFVIRRTGVYRVPLAELRSLGWTETDLSCASLSAQGAPVAFRIETSGRETALCFFGKSIESRYTPESVYILEARPSQGSDTGPASRPHDNETQVSDSTFRVRLETDRLYQPLADQPIPWFWERLTAPERKNLGFRLETAPGSTCTLRIRVWAQTQAGANPDHHLRITANGVPAIDEKWDGAGVHTMEKPVRPGVFREGPNAITVDAVGDTGAPADIVYFDTLEISCQRQQSASSSKPPFLKPERVVPVRTRPDLRDPALEADYVAIGSEELLAPLGPLFERLRARRITAAAVPAQAVFDQFSHGTVEPEAVRHFLRFASEKWKRPPRFLLLVGDATYDTLGFLRPPDPGFLPAFFTRTTFGGEAVSDIEFARLKPDSQLALAVGRIPARTPSEVKCYVEKVVRFEALQRSGSRPKVLAVADPSDQSFRRDAQEFLNALPTRFEKALYLSAADAQKQNLPLLLAYFGHGSLRQLGRDNPGDGRQAGPPLGSLKASIAFHITCLSGFFVHPEVRCLAEEQLLGAESPAVALLAPSSLTLPPDQRHLTSAIAFCLAHGNRPTVGEIMLESLRAIDPKIPGQREVRDTFLLFGCPALELEPR